jgi:hypothetical protein
VVLTAPSFLTGGEGAGAEGPPPVHNYQYKDSRLFSQLPPSSQGEKEQGLRGRHLYTTISIRILLIGILWCMEIALYKSIKARIPKSILQYSHNMPKRH